MTFDLVAAVFFFFFFYASVVVEYLKKATVVGRSVSSTEFRVASVHAKKLMKMRCCVVCIRLALVGAHSLHLLLPSHHLALIKDTFFLRLGAMLSGEHNNCLYYSESK